MQVTHYKYHLWAFVNTVMEDLPVINNAKYLDQLADIS